MFRIDNSSFKNTAQAVFELNESARERHAEWPDLLAEMIANVYAHMHDTASFGFGGYELTAFQGRDGQRHVRAAVQAYTVMRYLKAN